MLALLLFTAFACLTITVVHSASPPNIWPLPSEYTVSDSLNLNVVDRASFIFSQNQNSAIIAQAFERYAWLCFPHDPEGQANAGYSTVTGLQVSIKDASEDTLGLGMDESYALEMAVGGGNATLTANTVWGALRGLETFSQLIVFDFEQSFYRTFAASITDEPRFSHRGILTDTSRHFQTVESLRSLLMSMSFAKLNVLHWHIVDGNSFPFESKKYPKLWNGAYSESERYSQNDVTELVEFAKSLGIRVVVEFDMPGHANSWCVGYPEICPSSTCTSPMNVASNSTWELLTGLIAEVSALFPDKFIHLGGDEVNTKCWDSDPAIVEWMNATGYNSTTALQYFDERVIDIASDNGKFTIQWDEVFTNFGSTLNKEKAVVQVWHGAPGILQGAVAAGLRSIYSPDQVWYLDQKSFNWTQRYKVEPYTGIEDPAQQALVIGGEGCMWGETVDASDIEQTVWPGAASVAERLWSPRDVNSTDEALSRIIYFRCLLNQRGIAAAPVKNAESRQAPPGPGSCYNQ